jgi:hypothetical protein
MATFEMFSCVSTATYDLTYETEGEREALKNQVVRLKGYCGSLNAMV